MPYRRISLLSKTERKPKKLIRYCKVCNEKVDKIIRSKSVRRKVICSDCKKKRRPKTEIHDYEIISKIYLERKKTNIGYCKLAEKYGINKWTIYDYIKRYEKRLNSDFGV